MGKIAIDHADSLEPLERLAQFNCREGPEPPQGYISNLVPLFAQAAHRSACRRSDGAESDQDRIGIFSHEFAEIGCRIAFAKNLVELVVGFLDHSASATRRLP